MGEPPEWLQSKIEFDSIYDDYVHTDSNDPIGHGTSVCKIIGQLNEEAVFSTFQIAGAKQPDGSYLDGASRGDLIAAVNDAADSGVDFLNISAGIPHECGGTCNVAREVELAVELSDMCVVTATGNREYELDRTGMHCPAMLDSVIGVAGYLPLCGSEDYDESSSQWWLVNGDEDPTIPFCGYRGCCDGKSCDVNRVEKAWDGNVNFHNAFPDVVAPPIDLDMDSNVGLSVQFGTSFATPIVCGLLAGITADVRELEMNPSASNIRAALRAGSVEIDEEGYFKMDCQRTFQELRSICN